MQDVQLKPEAVELLRNGQEALFHERYGDLFVHGIATGGELVGIVEIGTQSQSDFTLVKARIAAANFTDPDSILSTLQDVASKHLMRLQTYQGGGMPVPNVSIADLIRHVIDFPAEVTKVAVPRTVLLQEYKVLSLPFMPVWVDQQHAREVLDTLMSARPNALTLLNNVNYVLSHPDQFESIPPQLNDWANQLKDAINHLTVAASTCVNNPKDAQPVEVALPDVELPKRKA